MDPSKQEGMIANLLLADIISTQWNACNKVSSLDNLDILQKEANLDFWSVQGAFQRNQQQKLRILHWEKEREKTGIAKVVKCCHQVTWAQKCMTKKRE